MALDLYQEYLAGLNEEDLNLETGFIFFCNLGIDLFIHASQGKLIASEMLKGSNPISYGEFMKIQKLKGIFEGAKERCELMHGEADLPYDEAERYVDSMLLECSILIRIYLSKMIQVEDLVYHYDERARVNADAFNKLFLPDLDPHDRGDIVSFQNKSRMRSDLLLAQLFVSLELGV
jgi:hypothetical protein